MPNISDKKDITPEEFHKELDKLGLEIKEPEDWSEKIADAINRGVDKSLSIALIAAVAANNVIGNKGEIPWHIPEDMRHFKELTLGHPVVMGRKTFESIMKILGKPLPGRVSVVITRQENYTVPEGVRIYRSLDGALEAFKNQDIFIIGGGEIYSQSIGRADTLYITHVQKTVAGDAHFPKISRGEWELVQEEKHEGFRFATYKRRGKEA